MPFPVQLLVSSGSTKKTKLTVYSGFHTNKNMEMLAEEGIDGCIADRQFRQGDPRFDNAGRYKERATEERRKIDKSSKRFLPGDFTFDPDFKFCICPEEKRMYRSGFKVLRGIKRAAFTGQKKNTAAPVGFEPSVFVTQTELRFAR